MQQLPLPYNNWKIVAGTDWTATIAIGYDDGTFQNLSGYTLQMMLADPSGIQVASIPSNGTATISGHNFVVTFPHSFTATLKPMICDYAISFTVGGIISPWLYGTIEIAGAVA